MKISLSVLTILLQPFHQTAVVFTDAFSLASPARVSRPAFVASSSPNTKLGATQLSQEVDQDVKVFKELSSSEDKEIRVGFQFKHMPPNSMTNVEESVTRTCADMSARVYHMSTLEEFTFVAEEKDIDGYIYDTHSDLDSVLPRFAVSIVGSTMILAWRGSSTAGNWISDANLPPVTSSRWGGVSKNLRAHAGFFAFAENDICTHEAKIVEMMKQNEITEVIMTGHSLGGGIASVAHVLIEGQLQQEGTIWAKYKTELLDTKGKEFSVKSVVFSAPSSIVDDSNGDSMTTDFLDKISSNACNIVYSQDVVPRIPGNMKFLNDMVDDLVPQVTEGLRGQFGGLKGAAAGIAINYLDDNWESTFTSLKNNTSFKDLMSVAGKYQHYGNIIYYANDTAVPQKFKDYGNSVADAPDDIPSFNAISWRKSLNVIGESAVNHLCTVSGPGLSDFESVPEKDRASRLYWIHQRAILKNKNDFGDRVRVSGLNDSISKAKELLTLPSMGAVVVWDKEDMYDGEGWLYVKHDVPRYSKDAKLEKNGFFTDLQCSTFFRSASLLDLVDKGDHILAGN